MRALRRAVLALGLASLAAAIVRLRGRGGRPPAVTEWVELPFDAPNDADGAAASGPTAPAESATDDIVV